MSMSSEYGNAMSIWLVLAAVRVAIMGYAAVRDARTRVFPNGVALAFLLVCAGEAFVCGGITPLAVPDGEGGSANGGFLPFSGAQALLRNLVPALLVCGALLALELGWRRVRRESGLGIGDLKFLFALMLVNPYHALTSFTAGLLLMALAGLALRRRTLPLLPFAVICYLLLIAVSFVITAAV